MRYIVMGLVLMGCAANGDEVDDTGSFSGLQNHPPAPPPGAVETRYSLDCSTLPAPESTFFRLYAEHTLPSHIVEATIPGYTFDPSDPPLQMAVHYRLSDEFVSWVHANGAELEQRGVESWDSELWFDEDGEALVDCEYIAVCKTLPCPPVEEMMDENGVVYPEKLFGWMQDPIELIVWTEPES